MLASERKPFPKGPAGEFLGLADSSSGTTSPGEHRNYTEIKSPKQYGTARMSGQVRCQAWEYMAAILTWLKKTKTETKSKNYGFPCDIRALDPT